jgi:Reverse transcriptase (RNA-dependent DNA polymerase)/Group II intron, maturase-specific domain
VSSEGNAPVRQLERPLEAPGDDAVTGTRREDAPVERTDLLERVLEPQNLRRALHQVRRHQGAPGGDGRTVDDLRAYLKAHWPTIRAALLAGTSVPQPVRRTEIPKPGGGTRNLGIPLTLEGSVEPTAEGTPQGGPLSPLLANLLLDELDKELERRGHRFARYADDANIYVRSRQAGERVMASVRRFLECKLRLKVNATKSAVDRPWNRTFLGFTFTRRPAHRRQVSAKALKAFKAKVRELTGRTRGRTIQQIVQELRQLLRGWRGFFGFAEVRSPLRDLDKWIQRRLRSDPWKQWGRRGYRELRKRGVGRQLAWHTAKSAHGPWRRTGGQRSFSAQ